MLSLPVADEVERLQGADDVLGFDGGHVADQPDRQLALVVPQQIHQHVRPVAAARGRDERKKDHGTINEKAI